MRLDFHFCWSFRRSHDEKVSVIFDFFRLKFCANKKNNTFISFKNIRAQKVSHFHRSSSLRIRLTNVPNSNLSISCDVHLVSFDAYTWNLMVWIKSIASVERTKFVLPKSRIAFLWIFPWIFYARRSIFNAWKGRNGAWFRR